MREPTQPSQWTEGHPISREKAKRLVQGRLPSEYENIALSCSAPLIWFRSTDNAPRILRNGTVTVVRTPKRLFGITAAHVKDQYDEDCRNGRVTLQVKDEIIDGLTIIDSSSKRDLATFELDERLIQKLGLKPISLAWQLAGEGKGLLLAEGRGLLLAGYPAVFRDYAEPRQIDWRPFFAIATAKTVTLDQIIILVPRDDDRVKNSLPLNCDLGGISGGPIIGIFETESYIAYHALSGVIYEQGDVWTEQRIVGVTAESIGELGNIY